MSFELQIDGAEADAETVELLIDIVLMALSFAPFEYSEPDAGVALCQVLAMLSGEEETMH
jgi:hypothetical protein